MRHISIDTGGAQMRSPSCAVQTGPSCLQERRPLAFISRSPATAERLIWLIQGSESQPRLRVQPSGTQKCQERGGPPRRSASPLLPTAGDGGHRRSEQSVGGALRLHSPHLPLGTLCICCNVVSYRMFGLVPKLHHFEHLDRSSAGKCRS